MDSELRWHIDKTIKGLPSLIEEVENLRKENSKLTKQVVVTKAVVSMLSDSGQSLWRTLELIANGTMSFYDKKDQMSKMHEAVIERIVKVLKEKPFIYEKIKQWMEPSK